jgi:hypothetical protein
MATITCPSCQKRLQLPPLLATTLVQCPGCQTTFQADGNAVPQAVPALKLDTWVQTIDVGAQNETSSFDFGDEDQVLIHRVRRKTVAAIRWLRLAVLFNLLSLCISCPCSQTVVATLDLDLREETFLFLAEAGGVVFLLCVALMHIASIYLHQQHFYGLVLTAAGAAIVLALKDLLQYFWLLLLLLDRMQRLNNYPDLGSLVAMGLNITALVFNGLAGVKTLVVLADPEVRKAFR